MTVHLPDLFAKLSAYRFAAKIMCNGFIEVCNRCTHFLAALRVLRNIAEPTHKGVAWKNE